MRASFSALVLVVVSVMAGCKDAPEPVPDVTSEPQSARDAALEAARQALEKGVPDEAIARMAPIVRERPDDYDARVMLARGEALAEQYEAALKGANLALAINAKRVDAWLTKSVALAGLGEEKQAIEAAERALEKAPNHEGVMRHLAALYGMTGATPKQKELLEKLVALSDRETVSRVLLARIALAEGDTPAAERLARRVVELDPHFTEAQIMLAALAYDRDDYATALERTRIALTSNPDNETAHTLLEASFYVTVAAELTCAVGERPWQDDATAAVLSRVRDRYELTGVSTFYDLDETYGSRDDVQTRIARAAKKLCPDK